MQPPPRSCRHQYIRSPTARCHQSLRPKRLSIDSPEGNARQSPSKEPLNDISNHEHDGSACVSLRPQPQPVLGEGHEKGAAGCANDHDERVKYAGLAEVEDCGRVSSSKPFDFYQN